AHTEARGVWLIEGGIHALARALRKLAEQCGAEVRTGEGVAQVVCESGRVQAVQLQNGERMAADCVVCNADPAALATGKFGTAPTRSVAHMEPSKRSLSAYVTYAHAETSGFDLTHHNVFFSRDYAREFREIMRGNAPSEPTVYVCAQDRPASDEHVPARAGRERLQIIVNAPSNGDTHTHTQQEIDQCTNAMTSTLARCGLSLEEGAPRRLMTPSDWERLFPATGGALYGRASHGWAASFQRQGPRTRIKGLYCAGGATHPAAGVPMAALSGLLAAKVVRADLASIRTSPRGAIPGGTSTPSAKTGSTA
ncbi:MAG: FAD-dependent oxidoreductase, partial [Pseudomonadota bacterium]